MKKKATLHAFNAINRHLHLYILQYDVYITRSDQTLRTEAQNEELLKEMREAVSAEIARRRITNPSGQILLGYDLKYSDMRMRDSVSVSDMIMIILHVTVKRSVMMIDVVVYMLVAESHTYNLSHQCSEVCCMQPHRTHRNYALWLGLMQVLCGVQTNVEPLHRIPRAIY